MDPHKKYKIELFDDRDSAEKAYQAALARGYKPEEVNVLMSEDSRKKYYNSELVKEEHGDKSMEGLAIGGSIGGIIGGTLAAIAAVGTSIAFPGLGLVIAGPLAAGLAGAGAGSIAGGVIGMLIGWGIPEERARVYERAIKSGGIVLAIEDHPEREGVEADWAQYRHTER